MDVLLKLTRNLLGNTYAFFVNYCLTYFFVKLNWRIALIGNSLGHRCGTFVWAQDNKTNNFFKWWVRCSFLLARLFNFDGSQGFFEASTASFKIKCTKLQLSTSIPENFIKISPLECPAPIIAWKFFKLNTTEYIWIIFLIHYDIIVSN